MVVWMRMAHIFPLMALWWRKMTGLDTKIGWLDTEMSCWRRGRRKEGGWKLASPWLSANELPIEKMQALQKPTFFEWLLVKWMLFAVNTWRKKTLGISYENKHQKNVTDFYFTFVYYLTTIFKSYLILVVSDGWKGAYEGINMPWIACWHCSLGVLSPPHRRLAHQSKSWPGYVCKFEHYSSISIYTKGNITWKIDLMYKNSVLLR